MKKGIIGRKVGMTQIFDEKGNVVYTGKNTVVKKTVTELAKEVIAGK